MQAGAFLGALLANPVADKWGRKPGLLTAALFAAIGGMMQAASSGNLGALYAGRFIEGLGLGAATMLTPTYISENAPRAVRGMLVGLYQLFETMGAMIAFWINCMAKLFPVVVSQLTCGRWSAAQHQRQRTVASAPSDAVPPRRPPIFRHAPVQRIPPMARQDGSMGKVDGGALARPQAPG